jgi:hypothetical protein
MTMRKTAEDVPMLRDGEERDRSQPTCSTTGQYTEFGFGAPHEVVNAVFGDGSVRSISYDIEWNILDDLGRRADGRTIDGSSY